MPRTFAAAQAERFRRGELRPVKLLVLTIYSDRKRSSVSDTYYFADRDVRYPLDGGSAIDFWPFLQEVDTLTTVMSHVPSASNAITSKGLRIQLANSMWNGQRLSDVLQGVNIEGAGVALHQVLVSAWDETQAFLDLSSESGTDHWTPYRGRVARMAPVTSQRIDLECETDLPVAKWVYANDGTLVDPLDLGTRIPHVYGSGKRIPGVGISVGWATTSEDFPDTYTGNLKVGDASGFPQTGSFALRIDEEEVAASYVDDFTINVSARAQSSTTATNHGTGAVFVEVVSEAVYAFNDGPSEALDQLYVQSPYTGELVRLDSGTTPWTTTLAHGSPPGMLGKTLTTVTFSQSQLRTLYDELSKVGVPQQPVFTALGERVRMPFTQVGSVDPALNPVGGAAVRSQVSSITYANGNYSVNLAGTATAGDDDGGLFWLATGTTTNATRKVSRYRPIFNMNVTDDATDNCTVIFEYDFFGDQGSVSYTIVSGGGDINNVIVTGDWVTVGGEPDVEDAERASAPTADSDENFVAIFLNSGDAGPSTTASASVFMRLSFIEFDLVQEDLPQSLSATGQGYGLRFFADLQGIEAPGESGVAGASETQITSCDSDVGSWTENNATLANDVPSAGASEGSSSLEVTSDGGGSQIDAVRDITSTDLSDAVVRIDLYLPQATYDDIVSETDLDAVRVALTSDNTYADEVSFYRILREQLEPDRWVTLEVGTNDEAVATIGSTAYDPSATTSLAMRFELSGSTSGRLFYIDDVRYAAAENRYSVAAGALMTKPPDIIRHWIEKVGESFLSDADHTEAITNLGSDAWAFDARTLGFDFQAVLARMAYEARANIIPEEAASRQEWRLLTALSTYGWGVASREVRVFGEMADGGRDVAELGTRWTFRAGNDPTLLDAEQAMRLLAIATPDQVDVDVVTTTELETAEQALGIIEASPQTFLCIQAQATLDEVAGYQVHEGIRHRARIYELERVPWYEAYDLQPGDLLRVVPTWRRGTETQLFSLDSDATNWAAVNSASLADEGTIVKEGAGSLKVTSDVSSAFPGADRLNFTAVDVRGRAISVWVYIPTASYSDTIEEEAVIVILGSAATFSDNWAQYEFPRADFEADTWRRVWVDVARDTPASTSSAAFDPSAMISLRLGFQLDTPASGEIAYFDDVQIADPARKCRLIETRKSFADEHAGLTLVEVT